MPHLNKPGITPSEEVHAYARHHSEHVEWPIQEQSVLAGALFHVNSHSANQHFGKWVAFDGVSVFIDHVVFSGVQANALATRYKGRYITALYNALYLRCLDTAFTILAARGALPELGDNMAERQAADRIVGLASDRFDSPKAYFEYLAVNMPRCPIRRDAAHVLAAIMLAFIYQHEEGHAMLGHADYAIKGGAAYRLEAAPPHQASARDRSFHHLSEIDADRWAFENVLSPLSIKSLPQNFLTLSLTARQWIWLSWLGAALTGALLAVMDQTDIHDPQSWASHPHGILRARQTALPSQARLLAEQHPDLDYMNAFVDTLESLLGFAKIWPQYRLFSYAFRLDSQVEKAIIAFNATITDDHKQDYSEIREKFRVQKVKLRT